MRKLGLLFPVVLLMACHDPYLTARQTIMIGRGALVVSQTGFDIWAQVKKTGCLEKFKYDTPEYIKCMEPVTKALPVWDQSKLTVQAGLDEASALVNVAEKLKRKEPIDWLVPLKGAVCLLSRSLGFLPPATKQKIQDLIDVMGKFGCPVK